MEELNEELSSFIVKRLKPSDSGKNETDSERIQGVLFDELRSWVNKQAENAKHVVAITHSPKFIHSKSNGSSILCLNKDEQYVSTGCLEKQEIDFSSSAAYIPLLDFLSIELDGKKLYEYILVGDVKYLRPFAKDDTQANEWLAKFKAIFNQEPTNPDTLTKQVYFPISNDQYHLLGILASSTLIHSLYLKIQETLFSQDMREVRAARRKNIASNMLDVSYPNLARQYYGGDHPENVTYLNRKGGGKRNGFSWLLSNLPPQWRKINRFPKSDNHFWRQFFLEIRKPIRQLREFLQSIRHHSGNKKFRKWRDYYHQEITAHFLEYVTALSELPYDETVQVDLSDDVLGLIGKKELQDNWEDRIASIFGNELVKRLEIVGKVRFADKDVYRLNKIIKKEIGVLK